MGEKKVFVGGQTLPKRTNINYFAPPASWHPTTRLLCCDLGIHNRLRAAHTPASRYTLGSDKDQGLTTTEAYKRSITPMDLFKVQ